MTTPNINKTVGVVGFLIAVLVGIGVTIPYSVLLLLVCGGVYRYRTSDEWHIRVIVSVLLSQLLPVTWLSYQS
jgi:hypothetical protein